MFKALITAFSLYTRIPMPYLKMSDKDMRYVLSWFPVTGVVLGFLEALAMYASYICGLSVFVTSILLIIIPIVYTGGIHIDGFMDTTDALRSYKPKEDKLKIMDDPHSGAFAIIGLSVYLMVSFALYVIAIRDVATGHMIFICQMFILSRSLSAITCYALPKAKKSGMLYNITESFDGAEKNKGVEKYILPVLFFVVSVSVQIYSDLYAGIINVCLQSLLILYYIRKTKKEFGGITGDTAGWLLQQSELLSIVSLAVKVIFFDKGVCG